MLPLKVINLWAGPGAGKSTTAAGLFHFMKLKGENVELVGEAAKDATWEGNLSVLDHQLFLLGIQDIRLRRLVGQVEWAITDSPIPLGLLYARQPEYGPWFREASLGAFNRYDNYNVRILRAKAYSTVGRNQDAAQAQALDRAVSYLLEETLQVNPLQVWGNEAAPLRIYDWIMNEARVRH